jgi:hypothetical protein
MNLEKRIEVLAQLGNKLKIDTEEFSKIKENAYYHNKWFVEKNTNKAIDSIVTTFLEKKNLNSWAKSYNISDDNTNKKVGIIMAGNIPLVGFHDLLSVFISGHTVILKLSSKDEILMKYIVKLLNDIEPETKKLIQIEERLKNIDAIIATGSNNSYRYFEYYFGKIPNIIRKNRNGTAVLTGDETEHDLDNLANDIFDYFGLGCRNISKLYVPDNYDFPSLMKILDKHQYLKEHNKYMNNYDYNLAIAMLNKDKIFQGEVVFLKEDISYLSRIANIHYETYGDINSIKARIQNEDELIQVVTTKTGNLLNFDREVKFGQTQIPSLNDYSDGVDILEFLVSLN